MLYVPARIGVRNISLYFIFLASRYAVGCYYYLTQKFEKARVNFLKATTLNPYFAPAWLGTQFTCFTGHKSTNADEKKPLLGYGHTFAAQDESDQVFSLLALLVQKCKY